MPFRINHIHIKAPDPRKAAEWWAEAFDFKIISDETRPFGDRFIRCQAGGSCCTSASCARVCALSKDSLAIVSSAVVETRVRSTIDSRLRKAVRLSWA